MTKNNDQKNNPESKIEFYFLRSSAEKFSSDLHHFSKEVIFVYFL